MPTTALLILSLIPLSAAAAALHHQGVVAVKGERFTGTGAFRFALIDGSTGVYRWTSDGSAVSDPDAPTDPVSLTVINGVYNVLLGEATLANMTAIPDSLFAETADLRLRVWFDDNAGNGTHALTPDLAITPAPFANVAANAQRLVVPGTADTAVAAADNGTVTVASGDLTVTSGDVTVAAGNVTIQGDLGVTGTFLNFAISLPYTAQRSASGAANTNMSLVADSFCALTLQDVAGLGADDSANCWVHVVGGRWVLTATLDEDFTDSGAVVCQAACFIFGE
ncbi:MAG: hypothetical protein HOP29_10515 [Phycisphaerales bacterium]|nr:hypothetical protein [Phycisphaerales bacterium]